MMRGTSLHGHALRSQGRPYMPGTEEPHIRVKPDPETGHLGYGLCECGQVSGWLDSDRRRKLWHGEHKDDVRAAAAAARKAQMRESGIASGIPEAVVDKMMGRGIVLVDRPGFKVGLRVVAGEDIS